MASAARNYARSTAYGNYPGNADGTAPDNATGYAYPTNAGNYADRTAGCTTENIAPSTGYAGNFDTAASDCFYAASTDGNAVSSTYRATFTAWTSAPGYARKSLNKARRHVDFKAV